MTKRSARIGIFVPLFIAPIPAFFFAVLKSGGHVDLFFPYLVGFSIAFYFPIFLLIVFFQWILKEDQPCEGK